MFLTHHRNSTAHPDTHTYFWYHWPQIVAFLSLVVLLADVQQLMSWHCWRSTNRLPNIYASQIENNATSLWQFDAQWKRRISLRSYLVIFRYDGIRSGSFSVQRYRSIAHQDHPAWSSKIQCSHLQQSCYGVSKTPWTDRSKLFSTLAKSDTMVFY